MLFEDTLTESVLFTEGNGLKRSSSFKSKAEPSDAAEQVEDGDFFIHFYTSTHCAGLLSHRLIDELDKCLMPCFSKPFMLHPY